MSPTINAGAVLAIFAGAFVVAIVGTWFSCRWFYGSNKARRG